MSLEAKKLELIEWLAGLTDRSMLQKIARLKTSSVSPSLPIISVEELQERALKSEEAINQGDYTTFVDLKKEIKNW